MKKLQPKTSSSSFAFAVMAFFASVALVRATTVIPAPPNQSHLRNISARAPVQTGDNVMIGGFIITGSEPKQVLIRALGPSLSVNNQPVAGRLADPTLEIYAQGNSSPIASNDNWKNSRLEDISTTGLAPSSDLESAVLLTLNPGPYTAIIRGKNNGVGIGLLEVYELSNTSDPKLSNISARGFVQGNDNVLIGGFIVGGTQENVSQLQLVIRALGPSLTAARVPSALANPTLQLYDANGASLAFNDDWRDGGTPLDLEASGLAPTQDSESAMIVYLSPGNYTAIVRGKDQTSGIALVEVYDVPSPQLPGG